MSGSSSSGGNAGAMIFAGLTKLGATRVQEAERSKVLFGTKNTAGKDGKVKIVQAHIKFHAPSLLSIMTGGIQPMAAVYTKALHAFDKSLEWSLGGGSADDHDHDIPRYQVLHDMISYMHKLSRNHENSRDPEIAALKQLCPKEALTRKRKGADGDVDGDALDDVLAANEKTRTEIATSVKQANPNMSEA